MKEWHSENVLKMNSNKTQCILFATSNFNKKTETFQITINDTVRHMEDKAKNLGVIFDSRLPFQHHIKSLCSRLNGTLSYLNTQLKIKAVGTVDCGSITCCDIGAIR